MTSTVSTTKSHLQCPLQHRACYSIKWTREILAIVLSIVSLAGVVVVLAIEDGMPLDDWNFTLSANAVVSILGTISRASLAFAIGAAMSQEKWAWFRQSPRKLIYFDRFDEASKGPWGSIQLAWRINIRHWASIGALVTVALVGFEPLLQSIVSFDGRLMAITNGNNGNGARISQTSDTIHIGKPSSCDTWGCPEFDWNFTWQVPLGSEMEVLDPNCWATAEKVNGNTGPIPNLSPNCNTSEPYVDITRSMSIPWRRPGVDLDMTAYMYWQGPRPQVGQNSTIGAQSGTSSFCLTGNCTWPLYLSVGLCTSCNDISDLIEESWVENATQCKQDNTIGKANNDTTCIKYFLSGQYTSFNPSASRDVGSIKLVVPSTPPSGFPPRVRDLGLGITLAGISRGPPSGSFLFDGAETSIWSWMLLTLTNKTDNSWGTPHAQECSLSWCVKLFNSSMEAGILRESVIQSWSLPIQSSWNTTNFDTPRKKDQDQTAIAAYRNAFNNRYIHFDSSSFPRSDLQLDVPDEEAKKYAIPDDEPLRYNISQSAVEMVTVWLLSTFSNTTFTHPNLFVDSGVDEEFISILSDAITTGHIPKTFEKLANGMTNFVRDQAGGVKLGTVRQWRVLANVQWKFLALPIIVSISGVIFFFLAYWESRTLGIPAWKGSSLPVLSRGLDDAGRRKLRAESEESLGKLSHQMIVEFGEWGEGLELRENSEWEQGLREGALFSKRIRDRI